MSLYNGQTTSVFVENGGAYAVTKWSGSLNNVDANTKIYWPGGITPTITTGIGKKDIFLFRNIENKIFGTIVQNFL